MRQVPADSFLLNSVKVKPDADLRSLRNTDWTMFLRQSPSSRIQFLNLYNYAGKDTAKAINRFLRKAGNPPVLFDSLLTERARASYESYLQNRGFLDAEVSAEVEKNNKRAKVVYHLKGNKPYYINSLGYDIADDKIRQIILADTARAAIDPDMLFDVDKLNGERDRITSSLRNRGFFYFNREYLQYQADSINHRIDLSLELMPQDTATQRNYNKQLPLRKITFQTTYDPITGIFSRRDSSVYKGYTIYSEGNSFLRPSILLFNTALRPGSNYSERQLERTFRNFTALPAVRHADIRFREVNDSLNAVIMLSPDRPQSYNISVEGTNSGGDFGFAGSVGYSHNNIFRGAEIFNLNFRAAYEGLSGDIGDIFSDHILELGGRTSFTFPRFMFPFMGDDFKRRLNAQTEFMAAYNYQQRPEFVRNIAEMTWRYRWNRNARHRHTFDLLDINYVYLPWISQSFQHEFINSNSILRYSYEDHLILRTGYVYQFSTAQPGQTLRQQQSLRIGVEAGGNLTALGFSLFAKEEDRNENGAYEILNIPFSQYARFDFDYARSTMIDSHNSLAWRVGLGVGYPYGNSEILPFEKRYYAGGANSVRGWSVRTLGPGIFAGNASQSDLMSKSGDIRLDLSVEYRTKLFWLMELGTYIDAGNVWTIRDYAAQPGGLFRLDRFYDQIAVSYGLGLRFDFDFFLIRFDTGMKAYNPALTGSDRWSIIQPNFKRDFAFHFAIGYPF
jgi:outer membrane protein assembly factor BamA